MIVPAGHNVLVRIETVEEKTQGGIFIPKTSADRQEEANIFGELLAIGPTAWQAFDDGQPWAFVGDRVVIAKYGGFVIEDPDTHEKLRLLLDSDIVAIIR